ncbi:F-actin-capping protein subunit alpha [Pseudozyma hubeiensis]|nr:F-actin-capping protein subunit alpha [Pseudozyma hubeiensis]
MSTPNLPRLNEALSLLIQSPPGQTSQVYHDLRGILFDSESNATDNINDSTLQSAAAVALEEYNTQQLVTATLPDDKHPVIICQAGQVVDQSPSSGTTGVKRYLHPKLKKTFLFDHVKRTVSDVRDAEAGGDGEAEQLRSALEQVLEVYVKDRYPDGVSSVFAVSSVPVKDEAELKEQVEKAAVEDAKSPAENTAALDETKDDDVDTEGATKKDGDDDEEIKDDPVEAVKAAEEVSSSSAIPASDSSSAPVKTTLTMHHVGNRYNLSNFWSGRWRASYTLDPHSTPPTLTSSISVQVHYFENGNVQLNASKPRTFELSSTSSSSGGKSLADEVVRVIGAHEDAWQKALEQSYDELAERAFKALRRQLPLTRQKVDWDKVLNYKLGDELARA